MLRGFSELTLPAIEEAKRLGASEVDTEHLLLGLLRLEGVVARVFTKMGVSVDEIRAAVESQLPSSSSTPAAVTLSGRAKRVLELAADEARAMEHRFIGSFHLLFALLQEKESAAAQALEQFGVTLDKARQAVKEYLVELECEAGVQQLERTGKETTAHLETYLGIRPEKAEKAPTARTAVPQKTSTGTAIKERRLCMSLKMRHALLRAADKALSANTETIEFEHLLAAVRELQREG